METKKKVLLVDDSELLIDLYTKKATHYNIELKTAKSGAEALEVLKDGFVPDMLVLDVAMVNMDGLELLETIQKEKLAPNAEAVVLSNTNEEHYLNKAKVLGVKKYIIKASRLPNEVMEDIMGDDAIPSA